MSRYTDKSVPAVKALFKYWFDKSAWHKPTILILDNLHKLLGAEVEVIFINCLWDDGLLISSFQHADSFRARHITELFLAVFSSSARSAAQNSRGIVILATTTSTTDLHPLLSSSHIFDEVVNVKSPNKDARKDV